MGVLDKYQRRSRGWSCGGIISFAALTFASLIVVLAVYGAYLRTTPEHKVRMKQEEQAEAAAKEAKANELNVGLLILLADEHVKAALQNPGAKTSGIWNTHHEEHDGDIHEITGTVQSGRVVRTYHASYYVPRNPSGKGYADPKLVDVVFD